MNRRNQLFSKVLALILAGLFFGTSLAILTTNTSGDDGEREDYGVVLTIDRTERTIFRNETATYTGIIKNIGNNDDIYRISFGGKDYGKEGISVELTGENQGIPVDPDNLSLEAEEEFFFILLITITKDSGSYEVSMMVQSKTENDVWDAVKTRTKVVRHQGNEYDFALEVNEDELTTTYGIPVIYILTLVNTGNIEDSYTVELEFEEDHVNVHAVLYLLRSDGTTGPSQGYCDSELEISLDAGEKIPIALQVEIEGIINPGDPDGSGYDDSNDGSPWESYIIHVIARSHGEFNLEKTVTTTTIIKGGTHERLSFECYEHEKSIAAGGMAEYFLYLNNYGWSPVEVMLNILEHNYTDISAELFLRAPYWIMDYDEDGTYDDNYFPGMKNSGSGTIYDPEGNAIYPGEDDIIWDDYGGLIPVDENFSYVIYPYEQVQFLLRVNHLYNGSGDGEVGITLYSAEYEIGVCAESISAESERGSNQGFSATVMTHTEVIYDPQYGIEMWPKEERKMTRPRQPVEYIINLENTGNVEEVVELTLGGEAYGLEGVSAYLYALHDWHWIDHICEDGSYEDEWYYDDPVVTYTENGDKVVPRPNDFEYNYGEQVEMMPNPFSDKLRVSIDAGHELKVILGVTVYYESGSYNITVNGVVVDHPGITREVRPETVIKEQEYEGFIIDAPVTEHTALAGENVDYHISIYNPSYYMDEILLELGGKDLNREGVEAELFLKKNVYYFEPHNGEFLRKDKTEFYMEFGGALYDSTDMSEKEFRKKHPDFNEDDLPWADEAGKEKSYCTASDTEEYYFDNTGMIYKNYDCEYGDWEEPDQDFNEDDWLVSLPGEENRITLGPFEEVWLVLRVVVVNQTGVFNIDVSTQSVHHPEYMKIVSTETHIKDVVNHGLELFIGDPVHYTAYGVTTVYVFQLTNTGDIRDTVLLGIEGADAEPNVHIEIGVMGTARKEPVILKDKYNNFILPYDDTDIHTDEKYNYRQWAEGGNIDTNPYPGNEEGNEYKKQFATINGEVVEGNRYTPFPGDENDAISGDHSMLIEPVEYTYYNWDSNAPDSKDLLNEINYISSKNGWRNEEGKIPPDQGPDAGWGGLCSGENMGSYDLDCGFIPYQHFGEKYVDLEAGETVIVTMKVTVYNWDWIDDYVVWDDDNEWYWRDDDDWDSDDDDDWDSDDDDNWDSDDDDDRDSSENPVDKRPGMNDDDSTGNGKNSWNSSKKENTDPISNHVKNSYKIILTATSKRAPDVSAEAKTVTHIYDETIQEGIYYRKISGVFNVHKRNVSKEILEQGFDILPLLLESGKIEIRVSGNFSEGRLLVMNLNATNIRELGEFDVLFDGLKIDKMDAKKIINYTGTKAKYAILKTDDGFQIIVYIPHFSEHTILIRSASTEEGDETEFSGSVLAVGLVLGVVLGIFGFGHLQKKEEARKREFKLKLHENDGCGFFTPITKEPENQTEKTDELESLLNESLFFEKKD